MSFDREVVFSLAEKIVVTISNSASNETERNKERLAETFIDFYKMGQESLKEIVSKTGSPQRPLLGMRCIFCKSYSDASLGICPVCETPRP
jgi:hypothetical protein